MALRLSPPNGPLALCHPLKEAAVGQTPPASARCPSLPARLLRTHRCPAWPSPHPSLPDTPPPPPSPAVPAGVGPRHRMKGGIARRWETVGLH